jgi:hypothetical protein
MAIVAMFTPANIVSKHSNSMQDTEEDERRRAALSFRIRPSLKAALEQLAKASGARSPIT